MTEFTEMNSHKLRDIYYYRIETTNHKVIILQYQLYAISYVIILDGTVSAKKIFNEIFFDCDNIE